jgi:hypothetical protein
MGLGPPTSEREQKLAATLAGSDANFPPRGGFFGGSWVFFCKNFGGF